MNKYLWIGGIFAALILTGIVLIFAFPRTIQQNSEVKTPGIPTESPFDTTPKKGPPPVVLLDATKIQTFVSSKIDPVGIPVKVVGIQEVEQGRNASAKLDAVLSNTALPILHGRTYRGIVSLSARCSPPEPCKTRVLAPSQLGWSDAVAADFKEKVREVIQTKVTPPIRDDDHLFAINWLTTDTNERFTTYIVTSKDGRPRFESMLWFSPIEKQCRETPVSSRPLETSFQWDGYVKNGFGMEVITWKGFVTYSYQNGKLLTADPCANRSCLNTESVYLWEVDNDATSVTTRTIANAKPEEAILAYQIIWSVAFPKIEISTFKLEMPQPKGNAISGSFVYRGDGTWNKNN